jgi:serine/threonine protein kinase
VKYFDFKTDALYTKQKEKPKKVDYIVQELLSGENLYEYISGIGGYEESICRSIMRQCLDAL